MKFPQIDKLASYFSFADSTEIVSANPESDQFPIFINVDILIVMVKFQMHAIPF